MKNNVLLQKESNIYVENYVNKLSFLYYIISIVLRTFVQKGKKREQHNNKRT